MFLTPIVLVVGTCITLIGHEAAIAALGKLRLRNNFWAELALPCLTLRPAPLQR
jgi:hypothetical protein